MPNAKPPVWKRAIRWIAILVVLILFVDLVLFPVAVGILATRSANTVVGAPPPDFQSVSLKTEDGVALSAWYKAPENGSVILVVPGAGGSRESMRGQAQMLANHGFGVLSLDLRGHGESAGQANLYGWEGTRDIGAAMTFLEQQPAVEHIGGLGSSMGAEVLLGAASAWPALEAIVSDGATYRSLAEYRALPEHRGGLAQLPHWVLEKTVAVLNGDAPPLPLLDSITAANRTALLFIAAGNNQDEIDYNETFASAVGDRAELWVVPDVEHTGAFARSPEEYEKRVIAFLQTSLENADQEVP